MIVDILAGNHGTFTVDTSGVTEVTVSVLPGVGDLINPNNQKWFEAGDNILLDAVGVNLPFGFGQGSGVHALVLEFQNSLGASIAIPELAAFGGLFIPTLCHELRFDASSGFFIKVPRAAGGTGKVKLCINLVSLNVSMINAPAALNGQAFPVEYFLQTRHTKALSVGP